MPSTPLISMATGLNFPDTTREATTPDLRHSAPPDLQGRATSKERSSLTSSHQTTWIPPQWVGGRIYSINHQCKLVVCGGFRQDQPRLHPPDPNPQSNNNYITPITSGIHHQVHVFKLQDTTSNKCNIPATRRGHPAAKPHAHTHQNGDQEGRISHPQLWLARTELLAGGQQFKIYNFNVRFSGYSNCQ